MKVPGQTEIDIGQKLASLHIPAYIASTESAFLYGKSLRPGEIGRSSCLKPLFEKRS